MRTTGERRAQRLWETEKRALAFEANQVLDYLNPSMQRFIAEQRMVFVASSDGIGHQDASFRAGPAGFIEVLNAHMLRYPEFGGNGVFATLGNILDTGHIGLLFVDFFASQIGLHVNGQASIHDRQPGDDDPVKHWVHVVVEEAYIHCSKHIPRLAYLDKSVLWGTDDDRHKGGDYFRVKSEKSCRVSAPAFDKDPIL